MEKVLVAVFLMCALAPLAFSQIQTAKATGGEVHGAVTDGISIFKGIPFAAPPVNDLRWKAPAPLQAWNGIKKADAFGPACMQPANSQGNTAPSAKTDPNGLDLPKWPAFAENNQQAMVFTATPNAMPMPNPEKLKAFDACMSWHREEAKKDNAT